jgi:manganese/zinc/iron transport system ATP- binding protein
MQNYALRVQNLTVAYHNKAVLWQISATIQQGVMLAIVGPNGAGKTTLLKALLGLIKPIAGTVSFFSGTHAQNRGRIAYVPQRTSVDWDFPATVFDIVLMGCYGKLGWFKKPGTSEYAAAQHALEQVGMNAYADYTINQLSGGQQQRVFLARALMQDADLYLMDEPFIGVDMATEQMIVRLLKTLRDAGKTIIIVHHDLQTLHDYFDWVWFINHRSIACGPLQEVLTRDNMQATFGPAFAKIVSQSSPGFGEQASDMVNNNGVNDDI